MSPAWRRALRVLVGLALAPVVALVVGAALTPLPPELADAGAYSESVRVTDRDGVVLREVRGDDAARARWVALDEVGARTTTALLAAEDRRFRAHPGVDPVAVVRAIGSSVWNRRITSGASTLTMQLARLVRPHRRTLFGKLQEMALAIRIEASLPKDRVLEEYANRAPFGPGLRGIDAAARYWFDKPPRELSLAEAATLAAIPRGPDLYAPDKHPERVVRRRDRVLQRMNDAGWITEEERARAAAEPLFTRPPRGSFGAPHFVQAVLDGSLDPRVAAMRGEVDRVTTTIARELQGEAEAAALVTLRPLAKRHVTAASVVVLDNASGEIMAYVGSPDVHEPKAGWNDGARAKRQPGSTLKPFVYGLAMEELGLTAASVLPDVELHLEVPGGTYTPLDYDERYHGPVRLREALANSLNVPAVWTADQLGTEAILARLRELGLTSLTEDAAFYGPAIALGDGEVTLLELANAYATLARGGVWRPVSAVRAIRTRGGSAVEAPAADPRRVMPLAVATAITDVLADKDARLASFGERSALELPFPVAAKTGTSKGYRDNWTVGFTRDVTVAVWVGNFDGSPMEGVSGITGAGPLFRAVMEAAMRSREARPLGIEASDPAFVRVAICPLSGGAPTGACPHATHEWVPAGTRVDPCTMHESAFGTSYERFPPEYAAWAKSAHRDVAPESRCARRDRDATDARGLSVAWPRDGARFLVDPGRPRGVQAIPLRVVAPGSAERVALRVDGHVVDRVEAPFVGRWTLAEGDHVIVAEAPGLPPSAPVHVRVE
jgi:penicillin-binding protein 1C